MSKFEPQLNACKFVGDLKEVIYAFMSDVDARLEKLEQIVFRSRVVVHSDAGELADLEIREPIGLLEQDALGVGPVVRELCDVVENLARRIEKLETLPQPAASEPVYVPAAEQLAVAEAVTDAPSEPSNAEDAEDAEASAENAAAVETNAAADETKPPADETPAAAAKPADAPKRASRKKAA